MRKKLKLLFLSLFVCFAFIGASFKVFAYSGLLDTYSATGVSIVGLWERDSFTTSGHAYVQHWNNSFQAYEGGVVLTLEKHGTLGYSQVSHQTASGYGESDLTFALPSYGTYKFYFASTKNYNKVDFNGKVWDYR